MHSEDGKDDGHIWTVLIFFDHPHTSSHAQAYLFVQYARLGERDTAPVFHRHPRGKRKKYKATANAIGLYFLVTHTLCDAGRDCAYDDFVSFWQP